MYMLFSVLYNFLDPGVSAVVFHSWGIFHDRRGVQARKGIHGRRGVHGRWVIHSRGRLKQALVLNFFVFSLRWGTIPHNDTIILLPTVSINNPIITPPPGKWIKQVPGEITVCGMKGGWIQPKNSPSMLRFPSSYFPLQEQARSPGRMGGPQWEGCSGHPRRAGHGERSVYGGRVIHGGLGVCGGRSVQGAWGMHGGRGVLFLHSWNSLLLLSVCWVFLNQNI